MKSKCPWKQDAAGKCTKLNKLVSSGCTGNLGAQLMSEPSSEIAISVQSFTNGHCTCRKMHQIRLNILHFHTCKIQGFTTLSKAKCCITTSQSTCSPRKVIYPGNRTKYGLWVPGPNF